MTVEIIPEIGIPYERGANYLDLHKRAAAACATAEKLQLDLTPTAEDKEIAAILASSYAQDPEQASKAMTHTRASQLPASLVYAGSILDEYGHQVVHNSIRLRHMVTNKLIVESENPDARIRLRALELLGKISDVGLFTEKKEITVNHASTDDLRAELKNKLSRLLPGAASEEPADAEYEVLPDGG